MADESSIGDGIATAGLCLAAAIAFFAMAQCQDNQDTQREVTKRMELQLKVEAKP